MSAAKATTQDVSLTLQPITTGPQFGRVHAYLRAYKEGKVRRALLMLGKPGIAKSAFVHTFATMENMAVRDVRTSQLDPVDVRGLPKIVEEDGVPVAHWSRPEFIPTEKDGPTILLLDEFNLGGNMVMNSFQQIIYDMMCGTHPIPKQTLIVMAGNRREDKAHVQMLSAPVRNRVHIMNIEPRIDEFVPYAFSVGMHPNMLAFISFKKDALWRPAVDEYSGFPSYRSWEHVSDLLYAGLDSLDELVSALGQGTAMEFFGFLEERAELPDIDKLLAGKATFDFSKARISTSYACVTSMATKAMEDLEVIDPAAGVLMGIKPEIAAIFFSLMLSSKIPNMTHRLTSSKNVRLWMQKHQSLIQKALRG